MTRPGLVTVLVLPMRTCGRCGHDNADHLAYCSACGRRLANGDRVPSTAAERTGAGPRAEARPGASRERATALAATVAVAAVERAPAGPDGTTSDRHVFTHGIHAARAVFSYALARRDADGRRRHLIDERDGARRLVDGALIELGQIVLADPPRVPELADLIEAVATGRARREAALGDLAAAETFRASEDLRLGLLEASAETEWKACEASVIGVDQALLELHRQKQELDLDADLLENGNEEANGDRRQLDRNALHARQVHLDEQVGALRERGAALRASTIAARAKMDQSAAARRQAGVAVAASITGHTRDRANAEELIRRTTAQIGQTAMRLRVAGPALLSGYARVDRLEATIADCDRQIAAAGTRVADHDPRKLILGVWVLTGILAILGALGIGLWELLR